MCLTVQFYMGWDQGSPRDDEAILSSALSTNICPRKTTDVEGSLTTLRTVLCLPPLTMHNESEGFLGGFVVNQ